MDINFLSVPSNCYGRLLRKNSGSVYNMVSALQQLFELVDPAVLTLTSIRVFVMKKKGGTFQKSLERNDDRY